MGTQKNCVYNFRQMEVLNADEDSFFSNGDEPYFVFISFRSRTATKGSTQTFINTFDNDKWAKGSKAGTKKDLPASMGRVVIPVSLLDLDDLVQAAKNKTPLTAEIVGVVGFALESDATPFKVVREIMGYLRNGVHAAIADVVENLPADPTKIKFDQIAPDIQKATAKIKPKLTPSLLLKAVSILVQSAADPDDVVGLSVQFNVCVNENTLLIFNTFSGKNVQIPNILAPQDFALNYKGSGVHYVVRGNIALE